MAEAGETGVAGDPEGELAALDSLAEIADENARDDRRLARGIRQLRAGRAKGRSWRDLLAGDRRPGVLVLVSRMLGRLTDASGRLRRVLAHGLHLEGATIAAIATLFGVSHQRVSALLHRHDQQPPL
jgi:hypothetical protein